MTYKTIVVHLDSSERCGARVDLAARLALDFEAHLAGLYVTELPMPPGSLLAGAAHELMERIHAVRHSRDQAVAELFRTRTSRAGLNGAEMRYAEGDVVAALGLHARYADLLVIGQTDPDDSAEFDSARPNLPDETVLASVRPVLVVPYAGTFTHLTRHILIAWDASPQAARSVHAALPLLARAARVTVFVVNAEKASGHGAVPGADISLYLARHAVRVDLREEDVTTVDIADWMMSRAFDLQADMIVMGAYGHSLMRERVLGGVTRSILGQMTVPVLLEH